VVGNDADLGVLAEHVRGAAANTGNAIYLSSEVGVGGGIVLDGRLINGAGGYGGEVGHMVVNPRGALCRCGNRGCWETEIGRDAVITAAGLDPMSHEIADAVAVLESGDAKARKCMDKVGRWLGIGLANLVNIVNPEVIVLGGHLREIYPYIERTTLEGLSHALPAPREQVTLHTAALGGDSTLLGAAESAFGPLLDDPLGTLARSRTAAAS
jgi:predicted NBD/HSP70 family sugar kinase